MAERGSESVGIDLGTTYSALAYVDRVGIPRMLCNSRGHSTIPSVVQFRGEECVVGEPSEDDPPLEVANLARSIKSHIGSNWRKIYRGHMHSAESLSAIILRALIDDAQPRIGPVNKAVVTVPAYFTEKRRRATQHAGEIAGLEVIATLNEPMAATLAFCLNAHTKEQTVLVYDLGGGTFDVTIVRIAPNEIEELATNGILDVGGSNWDQALIDLFVEDVQQSTHHDLRNDPQAMERLRQACERAKRRLGRSDQTTISIDASDRQHTLAVTRDQLEVLTSPLIQNTKLTTELALEDAGLSWNDLSRVILVGGASQMPAIRRMLIGATDAPVDTSINPVTAVALGAAIYAHQLDTGRSMVTISQPPPEEWSNDDDPHHPGPAADNEADPELDETVNHVRIWSSTDDGSALEDSSGQDQLQRGADPSSVFSEHPRNVRFVTAHGVGVKLTTDSGKRNEVLIPRNTAVPARISHRFLTAEPTRRETFVRVEITQGDTTDANLAELLGIGHIEGFPAGLPAGQQVDVSMEFDMSGRLQVSAVHKETGKQMSLFLDIPGGLTCEEILQQQNHLSDIPQLRVVHASDSWSPDTDDDDDDISDLVEELID